MNLAVILLFCGCAFVLNAHKEFIDNQNHKIEQLTERVHLLENALADQSGVKK